MASTTPHHRLYFLDNLRWIMIARVVLFHVGAGYSGLAEFYVETQAGGVVAVMRHVLAAMPGMDVLFFIAGYFALPSLIRRGHGGFVGAKLYRLGIPYLLCVVFLGPLMPFLGFYSQSFRALASDSYGEFWSTMLADGVRLELADAAFTTNAQLHPMHFWFLSELLLFLFLFALAHAAWRRWRPAERATAAATPPAGQRAERVSGKSLLIAAAAMAAVQVPTFLFELRGGLFLGIVQVQPMSWFHHGAFFGLGIYAQSQGWFTRLAPAGWRAFGLLLAAMAVLGAVGFGLYQALGEEMPRFAIAIFGPLGATIASLWFLVIVVGITHRYMNRASTITAQLTQASYPTYLIHYPLILVFRLFLLTIDLPTPVKAIIVFTLTASTSVFVGLYLMRARPRLAALSLVGLHVLVVGLGLPRTSWSHLLLDRVGELQAVVPAQRPSLVAQFDDGQEEEMSFGPSPSPDVHVRWAADRLYATSQAQGLFTVDDEGLTTQLNGDVELGALTPTPWGFWAIDRATRDIVRIDAEGRVEGSLIDSSNTPGPPWYLAATGRDGGLFFSAGEGDSSGVYFIDAGGSPRQVASLPEARGLGLSDDRRTLYAVAAGDVNVWAFDVGAGGELSNQRPVAELFRGDGRYGRADLERSADAGPEDLAVDAGGRLFVASRMGLQVFSAAGRLLGVVDFPDVPLQWDGVHPLSVTFRRPDMSTLYVSCGSQVFSLQTVR
jgi:peptidoglycan/LPS O-acetylase OafA/YrhL